MLITRLRPGPLAEVDLEDAAGERLLHSHYALEPGIGVRLNMITSLTGAAVGADGTSDTLTSPVDRRILGVIREYADAVVVGAQSVRAEGYRAPRRAALAVVTASGDLRGARVAAADASRILVLHPAGAAERIAATIGDSGFETVPLPGTDRVEPADVVAALASRGLTRIVCEGGPALAAQFAAADVIDEYCVTVAPSLTASAGAFLPVAQTVATRVAGQLVDAAGFSYLRLQRDR